MSSENKVQLSTDIVLPVNEKLAHSTQLVNEVLNTQHFMIEHGATSENFSTARNAIYKLGVKSSYDENRMIFTALHTHKNQLSNNYLQECNGLILEKGTWKPLMVPPKSLRFNINTDASNRFLHQGLYHIYKAEDGTCINLYYYDKWCISTARGYEMNNIKWDNISYQQLITECLDQLGMTWETFTEGLDKTRCYSFGFKHPKFHRFHGRNQTTKYKMWFIQSVNLDNTSKQYLWASDKTPFDLIVGQEFYTEHVNSMRELYKLSMVTLDEYIEGTSEPCFGFILRSVNFEATKSHSDLFIESSLMRSIRRIWYETKVIDLCHANNWAKEDVITLNAYLDSELYETFLHLFPQYQERFSYYSKTIQLVVMQMIQLTNDNEINNITNELTTTAVEYNKLVETIAKQMFTEFSHSIKYELFNKTDDQKRRVFSEFITHRTNLESLLPLFINSFD
jgi:hypothetical protein